MSAQSHLTVIRAGNPAADRKISGIMPEAPDMPVELTDRERGIWDHVTAALLKYGLIHQTDGLTLTVICRTFCGWVDATEQLEQYKADNGGNYITESKNGYQCPHPLYYVERDYKRSLLQWLPEAALTIPAFYKIKGAEADEGGQGQLFADPVQDFRERRAAAGLHVVGHGNDKEP